MRKTPHPSSAAAAPGKKPWRRGRPRAAAVSRPDLPYTMKLPDGRTVYVEVPGRWVERDRDGQPVFTPQGVRFLDQVRALALPLTDAPRPAYITAVREALGLTQSQLGAKIGVDLMTISRWERGDVRPSPESLAALNRVITQAKQSGVVLAA